MNGLARKGRPAAVVAGLVLVSFLALVPDGRADTLKLRADVWCPYNCEPGSDKPGFLIEIARAIFDPAGYTIDYRTMPWSRALSEVRKGRIEGVVGAQRGEAPDLVYGPVPAALDDTGFAVLKGTGFRYQGPSSLDPHRIAVIADYNYDGGEIDAYLKANASAKDRIQFNTGDDVGAANLRKLIAGRVDLVIDSAVVMSYLVRQLNLTDKIDIVSLGRPSEIFIAFSPLAPQSQSWAALLSSGLESLRQRGELATILARYGMKDWQKP